MLYRRWYNSHFRSAKFGLRWIHCFIWYTSTVLVVPKLLQRRTDLALVIHALVLPKAHELGQFLYVAHVVINSVMFCMLKEWPRGQGTVLFIFLTLTVVYLSWAVFAAFAHLEVGLGKVKQKVIFSDFFPVLKWLQFWSFVSVQASNNNKSPGNSSLFAKKEQFGQFKSSEKVQI